MRGTDSGICIGADAAHAPALQQMLDGWAAREDAAGQGGRFTLQVLEKKGINTHCACANSNCTKHVQTMLMYVMQEPLLALHLVLQRALERPHELASAMVRKAACARRAGQLSSAVEAMLGARAVLQDGVVADIELETSWAMEDARLLWDQVR